ncbi:MAG: outer membrane protein assembly factor BamB family protein [Promethearchaeota archaeon]
MSLSKKGMAILISLIVISSGTVILLLGLNGFNFGFLSKYSVSGYIQKGPFIQGSSVTIQELDKNFEPTGVMYSLQTIDDFGAFSMNTSRISSEYVEIITRGYYFDEVKGQISDAELTLRVIAKVSNSSSVNVNILTTLATERIKYLIKNENMKFSDAKSQAEKEILRMFYIPENIINNITGFEQMDISKAGVSNAILLAASAILQGENSVGELSEFISKISADIKVDGILNNFVNDINCNSMALNLTKIRMNLEDRYSTLGLNIDVPDFEDYVSSDGDDVINLYDINLTSPKTYINEVKPMFNWTATTFPNASSYNLLVATDLDFNNVVENITNLTTTNYTLKSPLSRTYPDKYYWAVQVNFNDGTTRFWGVSEFYIDLISPTLGNSGNITCYYSNNGNLSIGFGEPNDNTGKFELIPYTSPSNNINTVSDILANGTRINFIKYSSGEIIVDLTSLTPDSKYYLNLLLKDTAGNMAAYNSIEVYSPASLKWNNSYNVIFSSDPAVDAEGNVYIGTMNGSLYAIYPNGTVKWTFNAGAAIESSPAIDANGIIYFGSNDSKVHALYANGTEKWSAPTGGPVKTAPAIDKNGMIYISASDGKLYAFYSSNGTKLWDFALNNVTCNVSRPIIGSNGTIYVATSSYITGGLVGLHAINPNGVEQWFFTTVNLHYCSVSETPFIDSNGMIYMSFYCNWTDSNWLFAINANGTEKWNVSLTAYHIKTVPIIAPDGMIHLIGFYDYILDPSNGSMKQLGPFRGKSGAAVSLNEKLFFISMEFRETLSVFNTEGVHLWNIHLTDEIYSGTSYSNVILAGNDTLYFAVRGYNPEHYGVLFAYNVNSGGYDSSQWPMIGNNEMNTNSKQP